MRSLFSLLVLLAGCAPIVVTPVVIREPRPEPVPLTIGVYYPEEIRSWRRVAVKQYLNRAEGSHDILVGEASVKLLDEALGLLFTRVVVLPTRTPVGSDEATLAAVIEPRIVAVFTEESVQPENRLTVRAAISYEFTLYSNSGDRVATWTVPGSSLSSLQIGAVSIVQLPEMMSIVQRTLELALRDAAWNFTSGFRDVPDVRRWLDERGVK